MIYCGGMGWNVMCFFMPLQCRMLTGVCACVCLSRCAVCLCMYACNYIHISIIERLFDKEYVTKINTFVSEMVKTTVGVCQKMKEAHSCSEEQAEQV